jgi:hypothetical protein
LTAIQGSATRIEDVQRAVENAEAILIALGTGTSTKPTTLYTDSARTLLSVHQQHPLTVPVIVLTGFGAGDSGRYQGVIMRLLFRVFLKAVYENKTRMEDMITGSDLHWILVRPGVLTNGPASPPLRVEIDYRPGMKTGRVSRRAVAEFMVSQAERPTLLRQKPALFAP